jgi:hypothetical protein
VKGFVVPTTGDDKAGPDPEAVPQPARPDREPAVVEDGRHQLDPPSENLADVETRLRVRKLNAELDKLQLETRSLERQLSWQGVALSWLQAATVLIAIIGIGTTLYLGRQQAAEAEENRAADRFDKALGRLADRNDVGVRLTRVAGLRLFLTDGNIQHQSEAAHYLVTAIADEKSQEVQQAILDAFSESGRFNQAVKDEALRTALELDRSTTATLIQSIHEQREEAKNSERSK